MSQTMFRFVLSVAVLLLSCAFSWGLGSEVTYTDGEVTLTHGGASSDAAAGTAVREGDVVRTGADSVAVIRLADGSEVKLRENTVLAFDSLSGGVSLTLRTGGVFSKVVRQLAGRYTVRSGRTVAGVRGTEFFVAYGRTIDDQPDIWLCVNSGSVEVSIPEAGQSVLVEQGKGINIVGGKKLTVPRSYPWTRKLNWNTDPAGGSVADRTNLDQAYGDLLNQDYD
jgi:ferric-dicitrate binding protein FerR (iron transport regulator)